ncbi:MAG TPA: RNA polymerase sporulation sigma factor SigF [Clostridia bacterium]|mgnify:CR=1 FL=1|nr:RNA polymerase sporulation sigma factor SigF [Clostridia bacterium]
MSWKSSELVFPQSSDEEDIFELIRASQRGDQTAKEKIIQRNLKLVMSLVQRFKKTGYEIDDLFQIGCIGLLKAVEKFDLNYNVQFSTYAVPMIIGEIRRFFRDDNPIKVSRSLKELANKARKAKEELTKTLLREPTIGEIAEYLGVQREDIVTALDAVKQPQSLQTPIYESDREPICIEDHIHNVNDDPNLWTDKLNLRQLISRLEEKEKNILIMRYFQDHTQAEIAKKLGISQVQVSRIEKKALKALREYL